MQEILFIEATIEFYQVGAVWWQENFQILYKLLSELFFANWDFLNGYLNRLNMLADLIISEPDFSRRASTDAFNFLNIE